jgi:hypothetical protein
MMNSLTPLIEIRNDECLIQGTRLNLPFDRPKLIQLLGEPDREVNRTNVILTWDQLGIHAFQYPETDQIHAIELSPVHQESDFSPRQLFSGLLKIEGIIISSTSTIDMINHSLAPQHVFEESRDLKLMWTLEYERTSVWVTAQDEQAPLVRVQYDLQLPEERDNDEYYYRT